jgi:hypothetical protein
MVLRVIARSWSIKAAAAAGSRSEPVSLLHP